VNDWRNRIQATFGAQDGEFAMHPLDEQRAVALVAAAAAAAATRNEVVDAVVAHGLVLGWTGDHLKRQTERVRTFVDDHWTNGTSQTLDPMPPAPEVQELAVTPLQPTLEDLVRAAGPIATAYFDFQERMQERSSKVDEAAIAKDAALGKGILIVTTVLSLGIMALAGILIIRDHDQSARDLIQLIVSLAAAGFGGYGFGRLSERGRDESK
jgi:hypothetical protein